MQHIMEQLKCRGIETRIMAAKEIIEGSVKLPVIELTSVFANHPGFGRKRKRPPVDCQRHTKRWLWQNYDLFTYQQINDDPYEDMYILPDIMLDEVESGLLEGARASAEESFEGDGGRDTLDILIGIFGIAADDVKFKWIQFDHKHYATYSDYYFMAVFPTKIDNRILTVHAIYTNGKVMEVSLRALDKGDGGFISLCY